MFSLRDLCSIKIIVLSKERHNLQLLQLPQQLIGRLNDNAINYYDIYCKFFAGKYPHNYNKSWNPQLIGFLRNKTCEHMFNIARHYKPAMGSLKYYQPFGENFRYCLKCQIKWHNNKDWWCVITARNPIYNIITLPESFCSNCYCEALIGEDIFPLCSELCLYSETSSTLMIEWIEYLSKN
jgi:hypothetical protein